MAIFDPLYGELFTAKEVCNVTGLTLNQLRNWRVPARQDKAPFGFVSIGVAPYYRKVVVMAWLDKNGGSNRKYVPIGLDHEFPLDSSLEVDSQKREHLAALADITTATMWHRWYTRISETLRADFGKKFRAEQKRLYSLYSGMAEDDVPTLVYGQRFENFELFYVSSVLALRSLWAEINEWSVSDRELIDLPIGDVPPAKEIK